MKNDDFNPSPFVRSPGVNVNSNTFNWSWNWSYEFKSKKSIWIFAVGMLLLLGLLFLYFYPIYSDGMNRALEIANSNHRLVQYFGKPIEKGPFFKNTFISKSHANKSTLNIGFEATGSKKKGKIHFEWIKKGQDWIVTDLIVVDSEGKSHQIIDSAHLRASFTIHEPDEKTYLANILKQLSKEQEGYLTYIRSTKYNDFMQISIIIDDDKKMGFSIAHGNAYAKEKPKLYHSKETIYDNNEILKILSLYASGSDSYTNLIEWKKAIPSEPINVLDEDFAQITY